MRDEKDSIGLDAIHKFENNGSLNPSSRLSYSLLRFPPSTAHHVRHRRARLCRPPRGLAIGGEQGIGPRFPRRRFPSALPPLDVDGEKVDLLLHRRRREPFL